MCLIAVKSMNNVSHLPNSKSNIHLLYLGWDRLHGSIDGFNATRSENGDHVSLSGERATCHVTGKNQTLGTLRFVSMISTNC